VQKQLLRFFRICIQIYGLARLKLVFIMYQVQKSAKGLDKCNNFFTRRSREKDNAQVAILHFFFTRYLRYFVQLVQEKSVMQCKTVPETCVSRTSCKIVNYTVAQKKPKNSCSAKRPVHTNRYGPMKINSDWGIFRLKVSDFCYFCHIFFICDISNENFLNLHHQ